MIRYAALNHQPARRVAHMAHRRNNDRDREDRDRIREILLRKWDPICISGICPDNEYDSYISKIDLLLSDERADHQRLTDHLLGLAVNAMGLSNTPGLNEKCVLAAAALLALRRRG
jgi:hypothetical protein